jgi:hypothetical protein
VSLLADARGHKPMPSIETIQNMKDRRDRAIAGATCRRSSKSR